MRPLGTRSIDQSPDNIQVASRTLFPKWLASRAARIPGARWLGFRDEAAETTRALTVMRNLYATQSASSVAIYETTDLSRSVHALVAMLRENQAQGVALTNPQRLAVETVLTIQERWTLIADQTRTWIESPQSDVPIVRSTYGSRDFNITHLIPSADDGMTPGDVFDLYYIWNYRRAYSATQTHHLADDFALMLRDSSPEREQIIRFTVDLPLSAAEQHTALWTLAEHFFARGMILLRNRTTGSEGKPELLAIRPSGAQNEALATQCTPLEAVLRLEQGH